INMQALSLLANQPELNYLHYTDALFLDTETTGLSGGTGTLPFLIGMGWFEGESFIIRQIFVRDFTEERASLTFFLEVAKTKRFLVTFNGKAFDVGLIAARLIMNRLHDSLSGLPHLDLLHPSRRLLGHRTDNSRLCTLEGVILGIRREGDLPGSEIPRRYFDWLKSRDARFVVDVFEHNRLDVLSMVSLTMYLAEMLDDPRIIDCPEPHDLMAASKLLIDRGRIPDARCLLESLIDSDNANVARESRKALSLIYKRAGLWDKAIDIWELMITDEPGNVFAAEELAKWYEHRKRDFKKAHNLVHQALSFSRHMSAAEIESLHHRLNRIKSRIDF
ncbi:MAG: ribonuclease H-like domain-containing protein, partial [Deltaproteobacteria bacterium]|nr:ribonuclease H-like domain-containing protein [Deltaproteobacteria bacterium]